MRTEKKYVLFILLLLSTAAFADRALDRADVLEIFQTLTSHPRKTWIPSGEIHATHLEYRVAKTTDENVIINKIDQEKSAYLAKANKLELTEKLQQMRLEAIPFNVRYELSNEYTMNSDVVIRYDGTNFYWEINTRSREDSIKPPPELSGNDCIEKFDMAWNERRVFAWNGAKYVNYFRPGNHAVITDTPSGVNGPLTAGVIPWGYGRYSYKKLSVAEFSAVEVDSEGHKQIRLTVTSDDWEETFTLDPQKEYAITAYSKTLGDTATEFREYHNYQSVAGDWCPAEIVIDRFDTTTSPPTLAAYDLWSITSISGGEPGEGSFEVDYEYDAFIEDYRFGDEPLQFRYSPPEPPSLGKIDTDRLITQRLMIAAAEPGLSRNCGMAAMKYVAEELGSEFSLSQVAAPAGIGSQDVSLYALQQTAARLGLQSAAVKTDLETLKELQACQAILHLSAEQHYVVLGNMDDEYIRLIDLTSNQLFYRDSIDHFNTIWDGTSLLVDNKAIALNENLDRIDTSHSKKIVGACEQCNTTIQNSADFPCDSVGYTCGSHIKYFKRKGCGDATSGTCSESSMSKGQMELCCDDPNDPTSCVGDGEWSSLGSIDACG